MLFRSKAGAIGPLPERLCKATVIPVDVDELDITDREMCIRDSVYLLTVSDIGGQNVREFAKDWYRNYDLGYGEGKSGILFLIALDSRCLLYTSRCV